ncbi:MAG: DpnI domain-containing protein [Verrucomicrobiota bacterium]
MKRRPLAPTARRAGWIGCNFALSRIPVEARIAVVTESQVAPAAEVRAQFRRVKLLKDISITQRGWTLDVLNIVRRIAEAKRADALECGGTTPLSPDATCHVVPKRGHVRALQTGFTTSDVCAFERELEKLHPDNRHVRDNPVNNTVTRGRPRKRLRLTRQEFASICRSCVTPVCCSTLSAVSGVCRDSPFPSGPSA